MTDWKFDLSLKLPCDPEAWCSLPVSRWHFLSHRPDIFCCWMSWLAGLENVDIRTHLCWVVLFHRTDFCVNLFLLVRSVKFDAFSVWTSIFCLCESIFLGGFLCVVFFWISVKISGDMLIQCLESKYILLEGLYHNFFFWKNCDRCCDLYMYVHCLVRHEDSCLYLWLTFASFHSITGN